MKNNIKNKDKLYVYFHDLESRAVLWEGNNPQEFFVHRAGHSPFAYDLYVAEFEQWKPSVGSILAWIEGREQQVLIDVSKHPGRRDHWISQKRQIVSIIRSAEIDRLAHASHDIMLPGARLIYMPLNQKNGNVFLGSDHLKKTQAGKLLLHGLQNAGFSGFVLRDSALMFSLEVLLHEAEALQLLWQKISNHAAGFIAPGSLTADLLPFHWQIASMLGRGEVIIAQKQYWQELQAFWRMICPDLVENLVLTELSDVHSALDKAAQDAFQTRVSVEDGIELEFCHAKTSHIIGLHLHTNKVVLHPRHFVASAQRIAYELARQIRLRNLDGLIVFDGAILPSGRCDLIYGELHKCLESDTAITHIMPLSQDSTFHIRRESIDISPARVCLADNVMPILSYESRTIRLQQILTDNKQLFLGMSSIDVYAGSDYLAWLEDNQHVLRTLPVALATSIRWKESQKKPHNLIIYHAEKQAMVI